MTCCSVSVRIDSLESALPGWDRLMASAGRATVFDTPLWQKTWWAHFGARKSDRILSVCSDDGTIDLLAPLMQEDGVISFLGGTDLVDYHDFICPGSPTESSIDAVIRELSADRSLTALKFESIPGDSESLTLLPRIMETHGWSVTVDKEDVSPRLDLAADWDEYLAGLRKKDRHELRRKIRRLEASGEVRHIELTAPEDVESAMGEFFRLHRLSMPEKQEFMTADREEFFRDVAVALAEAGITRLCFLTIDEEKVATSLSFVVSGVRYLYNSGFDPDFRNLAVGLLNHAYSIRNSIEQGHSVFDFMRGNESYKYHLGGVDREVFRIVAAR